MVKDSGLLVRSSTNFPPIRYCISTPTAKQQLCQQRITKSKYNIKRVGAMVHPCHKPLVTGKNEDFSPHTVTVADIPS